MKHEVTSEIAGSVVSHVAVVGQSVSAGAVLLVVECMKTEFPVTTPVAGQVTWLLACAEIVDAAGIVATLEVP